MPIVLTIMNFIGSQFAAKENRINSLGSPQEKTTWICHPRSAACWFRGINLAIQTVCER